MSNHHMFSWKDKKNINAFLLKNLNILCFGDIKQSATSTKTSYLHTFWTLFEKRKGPDMTAQMTRPNKCIYCSDNFFFFF